MNNEVIKSESLLADALLPFWKNYSVWIVSFAILLVLFFVNYVQGIDSLLFTLRSLVTTSPFLFVSIVVAAYAVSSGADNLVARVFTGSPMIMILLAALFGGLSPFCSCGVIPLVAALLAMGVPLSAVMAFWLASPVIDPSSFVLTAGLLGLEFAIAKTFAAIFLGVFGGYITYSIISMGYLKEPLKNGMAGSGCGASSVTIPSEVVWRFWHDETRRRKFWKEAISTTLFLFKWLTLAFILESLMLAYMPQEWIATALGGEGARSVITATVIGVPAYLNGYAALPLVSGLVEQGMTPGAGLAFLVAGGVTSLPAAIAVFALVKRPVFVLYITFALIGSVVSGLVYQSWVGY